MDRNKLNQSLFDEAKVATIKVKNRFVRSATWENMTTEDGHVSGFIY